MATKAATSKKFWGSKICSRAAYSKGSYGYTPNSNSIVSSYTFDCYKCEGNGHLPSDCFFGRVLTNEELDEIIEREELKLAEWKLAKKIEEEKIAREKLESERIKREEEEKLAKEKQEKERHERREEDERLKMAREELKSSNTVARETNLFANGGNNSFYGAVSTKNNGVGAVQNCLGSRLIHRRDIGNKCGMVLMQERQQKQDNIGNKRSFEANTVQNFSYEGHGFKFNCHMLLEESEVTSWTDFLDTFFVGWKLYDQSRKGPQDIKICKGSLFEEAKMKANALGFDLSMGDLDQGGAMKRNESYKHAAFEGSNQGTHGQSARKFSHQELFKASQVEKGQGLRTTFFEEKGYDAGAWGQDNFNLEDYKEMHEHNNWRTWQPRIKEETSDTRGFKVQEAVSLEKGVKPRIEWKWFMAIGHGSRRMKGWDQVVFWKGGTDLGDLAWHGMQGRSGLVAWKGGRPP